MRKRNLFLITALLLLSWTVVGQADEGEAFVVGEGSVGVHMNNYADNPQRAGEYVNLTNIKDPIPDAYLNVIGGNDNALFRINLLYRDIATKSFGLDLKTKSYLSADFGYGSFVHNLDHDMLQNLQAKEGAPDGAGGYNPAGKQIYHTDNDPLGRYFLEYSKFHGNLTMDLPFVDNGEVFVGYADQRKKGYKQKLTLDHCAFCHIEGNTKRIDQQVETWTAGLSGSLGNVSVNYEFKNSNYTEHAGFDTHTWKDAIHPVSGGAGGEFGPRHIFEDVTLPYGTSADDEKQTHALGLKVNLDNAGTLKGSYTHTKRRNYWTGVENKFDAGALGYAVKLNPKMRLTAKFLTYETKVDDHFVDLPNFRSHDATGGNLNFDWLRISSANRKVYQGDVNLGWRVARGKNLKINGRYQVIDRPAMSQTQTSYLFDGVNNGEAGATLVPSTAFENTTKVLRLKMRYDAKLGMKGRYNVSYAFTNIDQPYMNPTAMCESSLDGVASPHVDAGAIDRIYYFQRLRNGNGTNQPSMAHKLTLKGSYQLSARSAFNAFLTYGNEKNDEMNIYQFERDMLIPGVNFWAAPNDKMLFTLGWTMNKVTSNANLCIPIFDG